MYPTGLSQDFRRIVAGDRRARSIRAVRHLAVRKDVAVLFRDRRMETIGGDLNRCNWLARRWARRAGRVYPDQLLVIRSGTFEVADRLPGKRCPDRVGGGVVGVQEESPGWRRRSPDRTGNASCQDLGPDDIGRGAVRLEADGYGQVGESPLGLAEPPECLATYQIGRGLSWGRRQSPRSPSRPLGRILAAEGGFGFREGGRRVLAGGRHELLS